MLIWKWVFIPMKIKLIFTRNVLDLALFGKWKLLEFWNGVFACLKSSWTWTIFSLFPSRHPFFCSFFLFEIVRIIFLCRLQVEGEVTENTSPILASSLLVEVMQHPKIPFNLIYIPLILFICCNLLRKLHIKCYKPLTQGYLCLLFTGTLLTINGTMFTDQVIETEDYNPNKEVIERYLTLT